MKRVLVHGFSEKAVREQEPLIQGYLDLMTEALHKVANQGPLNMVAWYEFVIFDIMGSLDSYNHLPLNQPTGHS